MGSALLSRLSYRCSQPRIGDLVKSCCDHEESDDEYCDDDDGRSEPPPQALGDGAESDEPERHETEVRVHSEVRVLERRDRWIEG